MPDSQPQAHRSHSKVIGLWPTIAAYADEAGVPYETAKQQKRRNSIGDEYRQGVVVAAAKRGFAGITFELLTQTAPKHSTRRKPRRASSRARRPA